MEAFQVGEIPLLGLVHPAIALAVSVHVLLRKRERAAIAWMGLIWLVP